MSVFGRKPATSVGATTVFRGDLDGGEDDIAVHGRLVGTVTTKAAVLVGEKGLIEGDVTGHTVTVAGRVDGTVVAHGRLHVSGTGRIDGQAFYGELEVDRGGVLEGHTTAAPPAVALLTVEPERVTMELFRPEGAVVMMGDDSEPDGDEDAAAEHMSDAHGTEERADDERAERREDDEPGA